MPDQNGSAKQSVRYLYFHFAGLRFADVDMLSKCSHIRRALPAFGHFSSLFEPFHGFSLSVLCYCSEIEKPFGGSAKDLRRTACAVLSRLFAFPQFYFVILFASASRESAQTVIMFMFACIGEKCFLVAADAWLSARRINRCMHIDERWWWMA